MKCIECKTKMEEKYRWRKPCGEIVFGQSYKIIILYQCPKCKRIEVK